MLLPCFKHLHAKVVAYSTSEIQFMIESNKTLWQIELSNLDILYFMSFELGDNFLRNVV